MRGPGRPGRADEPDVPAGTSAQRLTGFLPARDGFAFTNSWPPAPAVSVRTPAGPVGIGNAALGLCGGMVLAALDYWHAGTPPPASRPAPGSPLYRFIVRRLIASWRIPAGVATYYGWMVLPDRDAVLRAGTGPGAARTSGACRDDRSRCSGRGSGRRSTAASRCRSGWSPWPQ